MEPYCALLSNCEIMGQEYCQNFAAASIGIQQTSLKGVPGIYQNSCKPIQSMVSLTDISSI